MGTVHWKETLLTEKEAEEKRAQKIKMEGWPLKRGEGRIKAGGL